MMPLHQVLKSRLFDWTNGSDMNFLKVHYWLPRIQVTDDCPYTLSEAVCL